MKSLSMSIRYTYVLLLLGSLMIFGYHSTGQSADAAKPAGKRAAPAAPAAPRVAPVTTAAPPTTQTAVAPAAPPVTTAAPAASAPVAGYLAPPSDKQSLKEGCGYPMSDTKNSIRIIDPKTKIEETTGDCFIRVSKGSSDSADAQCTAAKKEANTAFKKFNTACKNAKKEQGACTDFFEKCRTNAEDTEESTADLVAQQTATQLATATGMPGMTLPTQPKDADERTCPETSYKDWTDAFTKITDKLDTAKEKLGTLNEEYGKVDTERDEKTQAAQLEMARLQKKFDEDQKAADADIRANIAKGTQGFNQINQEIRALEAQERTAQNLLVLIYQDKALALSQGSKAIMQFECEKKLQSSLKDLPSIKTRGFSGLVNRAGSLKNVKQSAIKECLLSLQSGREKMIKQQQMEIDNKKAEIKEIETRLVERRQELQLNQSHFEQAKQAADDSKNKTAQMQAQEMMAKSQESINILKAAQTKKQAVQTKIQASNDIITRQSNEIGKLGERPKPSQTETFVTADAKYSDFLSELLQVKTVSEDCCKGFTLCEKYKKEMQKEHDGEGASGGKE